MDDDPKKNALRQVGIYMTLPFILAVPPIIGYWIGFFLDRTLHTTPYLSYILLILGFFAGIREFYRIIKKYGTQ
jgi:ATP synthase protein I